MGKLTLTKHGGAVNALLSFYKNEVDELEEAGQYFMAAVALAFALETVILSYLLVELEEDETGQIGIPDSVSMSGLVDAANYIGALDAPIDVPSHSRNDGSLPKPIAKDAVEQINKIRRLIHPARALNEGFDPASFTQEQLREYREMYESVTHSLLYYI